MALAIPTVTLEDLASFHAKHFALGVSQTSSAVAVAPEPSAADYVPEAGDDLGYYPDGVKRTLTAEQVMMFRHSEIQRLLKERRREAAKRKQAEEDAEARKKARIDPDDAHTAVHGNVLAAEHTPIGTDSARSNRLQAALWASQQEWVEPGTAMPDDTTKAVQAVEVKGRAFLWPKISPE